MISRRTYVWSALGLATLLFFGVNIFFGNFFTDAKLDLTQSRQYTLSPGTRAIIAKLPEPVTLHFYFSKKNSAAYPATAAYAKRVRDLLGEYANISHGKIMLEDVDPEPFTPEEDEAAASGIRAVQTQNGDTVYFGMTGDNSLDDKEAIPYFAAERETELEYDVTSMLYQLSHPEKPRLAIISGLPLQQSPTTGQPMAVYSQLQHDYLVTNLAKDFPGAIPAGTNVLLIAHPEGLEIPQLRAIQMFVLKGGKALIFVDPLSEIVRTQNNPDSPPSSDLIPLLKGWGVSYSPLQVILDRQLAQHIRNGDGQPVLYPIWLHLTADNVSAKDPVTANLQGLNLASVGFLAQEKGATTKFEPLLTTSTQATTLPRDQVQMLNDPTALTDLAEPGGKALTIAARITGRAVYPGVGEGNINVIVVADTDIFDDRFWLRNDGPAAGPFADNGGFILSAVENLTGSDDLISLRMRGNADHPFSVVTAMQKNAELKFSETLQTLTTRLTASQQEIAALQQGNNNSNAAALTPQQTADIERVRRDIAATRSQLRDVQHNLRADIDRLGTLLAFLNILLMPLLVAAFAIAFGVIRRKRAQGKAGVGA